MRKRADAREHGRGGESERRTDQHRNGSHRAEQHEQRGGTGDRDGREPWGKPMTKTWTQRTGELKLWA